MTFRLRCTFVLAALAAAVCGCGRAAPADRPDIIFILTDDVRWDDLGAAGHPFSRTPNIDRIAHEGAMFKNAFVTHVICSPSRANILTGLYTHAHGILDNTNRSAASHRLSTFPRWLQAAGYETGFVGKWHMGNDDSRRPGFDYWVCMKGQGSSNDPELNVNGRSEKTKGYVTDVLSARAVEFIRAKHTKPYLLYFAHKAVHPELVQFDDGSVSDPNAENFIPAERHRNLYAGAKVPRRPNALEPPQGKPALTRPIPGLPPLSPKTGTPDAGILGRLRMLAAIDESTGEILKALEASGQLDRTLIVFTSDNGYWYGEHGLSVERRLAYEEGLRIPLFIRYPALIQPGTKREQMVLTIDFAPTLAEIARAKGPEGLHGKSLVPLFARDVRDFRDAFLFEHFSENVMPRIRGMGYQGIRTKRWKYIHYVDLKDVDELYDLNADPYEMQNLIATPAAAAELAKLKQELARQLQATGGAP